eukprot:359734-Chlamydomonas_euryale.AAC.5
MNPPPPHTPPSILQQPSKYESAPHTHTPLSVHPFRRPSVFPPCNAALNSSCAAASRPALPTSTPRPRPAPAGARPHQPEAPGVAGGRAFCL